MLLLYNLSVFLYSRLACVASFFYTKASLWHDGRKNLLIHIQNTLSKNTHPIAWFHCASLGEFEQARPVMEKFRQQFPVYKILLTFFSPSGYEIRKNFSGAEYVFYLPADTRSNALTFLQIVKPEIAFFTKYEFWFHYLHELKKRQIPSISFSAIFRESQLFFKPYGKFYKEFLQCFTRIFVQDATSLSLLNDHNIFHAALAGDTRFDRVLEISIQKKDIPLVHIFKDNKNLLIVGSSWPEDLSVLMPVLNSIVNLKIIIAPHELDESSLANIEKQFSGSSIRYSKAVESNIISSRLMIIDNIGMLSSLYQYADLAYIGGGFGKGIHNILEAAAYGVPVLFGPNYSKFKEANDLEKTGCAVPVHTSGQFKSALEKFLSDKGHYASVAQKTRAYVHANAGASNTIIDYCKTLSIQKK